MNEYSFIFVTLCYGQERNHPPDSSETGKP